MDIIDGDGDDDDDQICTALGESDSLHEIA